jgi:hypothetical protein
MNIELKEKIKIKPLTKAQILISLDRLTRFKFVEEKYLRVFKEIILSNLVYPKIKKNELNLMDYEDLTKLAEEILNFSLKSLNLSLLNDFTVNTKLLEYEKSVFKIDKNIQKLLENKINYKTATKLIQEDDMTVLNLKWLKSLAENNEQIENRENYALKFPIEKVIIVEGITEEILLPKFALIGGMNFNKAGIKIISAGGKNQVVKLFYQLADVLKLPIFILLDNDAKENFNELIPKLRSNDTVYILENGEFEDILPLNLLKRTLNKYFKNYSSVLLKDFNKDIPMTKNLEEIFKARGFEFKKAEFASLICKNVSKSEDFSEEIKIILDKLNS